MSTPPNAVATFWNGQTIIEPNQGNSRVISFNDDQAALSLTPLPAEREKVYPVHPGCTSKTRNAKGVLQPTHYQLIGPLRVTPKPLGRLCAEPRGVSTLRQEMAAYQANGARQGLLLLPHEHAVEVWGLDGNEPQRLKQAPTLEGGAEFPELLLNLQEIFWAG